MSSIIVTLPDASTRTVAVGTTALDIAAQIGKRLAEAAIAAKVDGHLVDVTLPLMKDSTLAIVTKDSKDGLEVLRHSTAHLLAQAIKEVYPTAQLTIGPVIEDGFYYDLDCPQVITIEDLPKLEKKMEEIAARKLDVKRKEFPRPEAIEIFKKMGENYKVELIHSFPPEEAVSAYEQGGFLDLCRGPHVPNTQKLGKFKLLSVAGAYWRGDEKNKMLQRIYGTAFPTQKELDEHLKNLEEAKKRDHRRLGPEIGLFTFLPVSTAMPFYLPKGTILHNLMTEHMRKLLQQGGYQEVICPQVMNMALWEKSGHAQHYKKNMFLVKDSDEEPTLALKPMNCPGHLTLFGATRRSYRELPLRFAEFTKVFRNERGGVTHGMLRVRNFSIDDGHIFCTEDQVQKEAADLIKMTNEVYSAYGFTEIQVKLATRPEDSLGGAEVWEKAEKSLAKALTDNGIKFEYLPGEGAFYGPKIEFHVQDSLKRTWQCGTIQLDFNLPERFELEYVDENNSMKRPVMIHRAIWGSLERFMGILVEHHAGHLPFWIAPHQITVINVTEDQRAYAEKVVAELKDHGLRVELDSRNEKLGYKIREAQVQKTPMMIVLGQKEVDAGTLSVRRHTGETTNDLTMGGFKEFLKPWLKPGGNSH